MRLIEEISKITPLTGEAEAFLSAGIQNRRYKRGEELVGLQKSCSNLYFVEKGIIRGYYFLEAKEVTNWFAQENEFATCFYAFITKKPSVESIEALEDSEISEIPYSLLQALYQRFPETERIGRIITETYYIKLEERLLGIQFRSAKKRYQQLLETRPSLIQRAALGQIASYLGITQETLSRMRADL